MNPFFLKSGALHIFSVFMPEKAWHSDTICHYLIITHTLIAYILIKDTKEDGLCGKH